MPLKVSIATSRKIGEPNYGSRGATVGLEMEVDSGLVNHPRQLHDQIRRLFRMARQSVDQELGSSKRCDKQLGDPQAEVRPATDRQIRAIQAIARRQDRDLSVELPGRFGVERPEELSLGEASRLIDALKHSINGVTH